MYARREEGKGREVGKEGLRKAHRSVYVLRLGKGLAEVHYPSKHVGVCFFLCVGGGEFLDFPTVSRK